MLITYPISIKNAGTNQRNSFIAIAFFSKAGIVLHNRMINNIVCARIRHIATTQFNVSSKRNQCHWQKV